MDKVPAFNVMYAVYAAIVFAVWVVLIRRTAKEHRGNSQLGWRDRVCDQLGIITASLAWPIIGAIWLST